MDKPASEPAPRSERQIRIEAKLECLKLAISVRPGSADDHQESALKLAELYAAFVLGSKG